MIEQTIAAIISALVGGLVVAFLVPFIREKWKYFKNGKDRRKFEGMVRKHDKQLKKELLKAGVPKDEL